MSADDRSASPVASELAPTAPAPALPLSPPFAPPFVPPSVPLFGIDARELEHFDPAARSIVRLYTSATCDVMLVCWEPGQVSSFHDHGPSESIVQVVRGVLEVRGDGAEPMRYGAGGIVVTPVGTRHQLANPGPGRLVTFHVYSPPMQTPMSGPLVDRRPDFSRRGL
jgi:quercetin dioxygenase-like cupin family protein